MINELRVDQVGTDNDEYFELAGAPLTPLTGVFYIVIGDGTGVSGVIESVTDLSATSIQADGLLLVTETTYTAGGTPDLQVGATGQIRAHLGRCAPREHRREGEQPCESKRERIHDGLLFLDGG